MYHRIDGEFMYNQTATRRKTDCKVKKFLGTTERIRMGRERLIIRGNILPLGAVYLFSSRVGGGEWAIPFRFCVWQAGNLIRRGQALDGHLGEGRTTKDGSTNSSLSRLNCWLFADSELRSTQSIEVNGAAFSSIHISSVIIIISF